MISTGPNGFTGWHAVIRNVRGEPIILNRDFLEGEVLGAICGGYAVAKCPSPRIPGRTGELANWRTSERDTARDYRAAGSPGRAREDRGSDP